MEDKQQRTSGKSRFAPKIPQKEKKSADPKPPSSSKKEDPITLPWKKPGDDEFQGIFDPAEFTESNTAKLDETGINAAMELRLTAQSEEPVILFFQLPKPLPSFGENKQDTWAEGGCSLKEMPPGYMGKMKVYKSGAVKMEIGGIVYDVSPGVKSKFAEEVAVINTKANHCCILGTIDKHATITPNVDSLLDIARMTCSDTSQL